MIRSSDELAWHRRHALLTGNVELQEGHLGPLVWQCVPGFPSGIRISRARRNWTHMRGLSFLKNPGHSIIVRTTIIIATITIIAGFTCDIIGGSGRREN